MAVYYRPVPGIPPWVRERIDTQGLEVAISIIRGEQTTATSNSDTTNATAFSSFVSTMQSSGAFTRSHGATARLSVFSITPNIHASNP